ncbi:MAG TPA: SPOR domain-containing protein [Candidatus Krumholzibacteria bacterium]|nr:SPOR domain-containing protein [Candidatus Krumholzibacteria bacterium]
MDDASPERNWLDDRLKHLDGGHGHFTVVNSPLRPVVERGDPWSVDVRHHELKAFVDHLHPTAEGEARVAVVTDVEEDPVARVQTAVLVGRRMAERGQRVLIVDADVRHVGLSRWASDRDLDAEGLVDVLQYGASVSAVRRHGPVDGVDLVSVGSYRPDDAGLFQEEDLLRLVGQVRGEADVVLILAPAWIADDRFHPLLVHADSVIVSLHLDRSLGERLQELLEYLHGLNVPVAGLMTYAGPDAAERRVDDVFDVEAGQAAEHPGVTEGPDEPEPLAEPTDAPTDETAERPVPFSATSDRETGGTGEEQGAGEWPESRPRALEQPTDDAGGSSTVFRVVAVIALVALVAFVGWWGLSSRDDTPPVDVAVAPPPVVEDEVPEVDPAAQTQQEPVASGDETVAGTPTGEGEIPPTPPAGGEAEEAAAEEPAASVESPAPAAGSEDEFPEPEPVETEPRLADWERDMARPVGPGYALHVASFTEEAAARGAARRLESAHGWQPDVRSAVIDGEQWYRVLVGRFDSRADALAARAPIGGILDLDWVGVVRVR